MAEKPSTSRERIIPIRIESDDSMDKDGSFEAPSTSSQEVIIPIQTTSEEEETPPSAPIQKIDEDSLDLNIDIKRTLPMFNVKEKIILVIDSAEDEKFTPFSLQSALPNRSLDMLKRAVEIFLHNKSMIDGKHEYALAVLNENNVVWLVDFTSNINKIMNALNKVASCETEDIFTLDTLFNIFHEKVKIPELCEAEGAILPPPYIVRAILLYARSYTMPEISESEEIQRLLKAPYFTLDVLMTHEPVDNDNNCNKIFNVLQNLDKKGFGHFFSVGRDAKTLFNSMGRLLGHPLQRPIQQLAAH